MTSRYRIRAGILLFGGLLALQKVAAQAQVLVLRSVGPNARNFPPGQRLPDNSTLNLGRGDSVTILRRSGTRVFRGPGALRVDAPPTPRAQIAGSTRGPRISLGAVRGTGTRVRPSDVWLIDAARSQSACIVPGRPVMLWQAELDGRAVTVSTSGRFTSLAWAPGQATFTLPATAGAGDGSVIEIARPGAERPVRIVLRATNAPPSGREATALALLQGNCFEQLDTFVALSDEDEPAPAN